MSWSAPARSRRTSCNSPAEPFWTDRARRWPPVFHDSVFHDAGVIAGKDLRLEWRSRVTTNQIVPFALLVLILFAFALDPDRGILTRATAGLYWVAVLFSGLLALQRA